MSRAIFPAMPPNENSIDRLSEAKVRQSYPGLNEPSAYFLADFVGELSVRPCSSERRCPRQRAEPFHGPVLRSVAGAERGIGRGMEARECGDHSFAPIPLLLPAGVPCRSAVRTRRETTIYAELSIGLAVLEGDTDARR
jgi:hypothetical protein